MFTTNDESLILRRMRERMGFYHPTAPLLDPLASSLMEDGLVDHSDNGEYFCG